MCMCFPTHELCSGLWLQVKVAINGFGRIGRNFLRCLETRTDSLLDVVAINDSGGVKQASHLLKYDSTLGKFDAEVKIVDDSHISINGKKVSSQQTWIWSAASQICRHQMHLVGWSLTACIPKYGWRVPCRAREGL